MSPKSSTDVSTQRPSSPSHEDGLAQFGAIHIRPAFHDVVAVLVDAIRSGYFAVGERLPSERELAAELEVSLPVVREALDVLERAEIVEVRRGRFGGTTLTSLAGIPQVLSGLHGEQLESIAQLLEVRRVLETEACLRAAEHARPADVAALREITREAAASRRDFEAFLELTVRFHLRIAVLSHNPTLTEFVRMIANRLAVAGWRGSVRPTPRLVGRVLALMDELTDAIEANDQPAICALVEEHIAKVTVQFGKRAAALAPPVSISR